MCHVSHFKRLNSHLHLIFKIGAKQITVMMLLLLWKAMKHQFLKCTTQSQLLAISSAMMCQAPGALEAVPLKRKILQLERIKSLTVRFKNKLNQTTATFQPAVNIYPDGALWNLSEHHSPHTGDEGCIAKAWHSQGHSDPHRVCRAPALSNSGPVPICYLITGIGS